MAGDGTFEIMTLQTNKFQSTPTNFMAGDRR